MVKAVVRENFFQIVIVRGARHAGHQYHRAHDKWERVGELLGLGFKTDDECWRCYFT